MSFLKIASRWAKRWSKFYTDATNAKVRFILSPRYSGKTYYTYLILQRLKRPRAINLYQKIKLITAKASIKCTRKHIRRRVVK